MRAFILHGSLNSTAISIGSYVRTESFRQKYPANSSMLPNVLWTSLR